MGQALSGVSVCKNALTSSRFLGIIICPQEILHQENRSHLKDETWNHHWFSREYVL
jgi:hypothetical protein